MKYIRQADYSEANRLVNGAFDTCGNISVTGSVKGMQKLYGWQPKGQVRCGSWIYNIGPHNVKELAECGRNILQG